MGTPVIIGLCAGRSCAMLHPGEADRGMPPLGVMRGDVIVLLLRGVPDIGVIMTFDSERLTKRSELGQSHCGCAWQGGRLDCPTVHPPASVTVAHHQLRVLPLEPLDLVVLLVQSLFERAIALATVVDHTDEVGDLKLVDALDAIRVEESLHVLGDLREECEIKTGCFNKAFVCATAGGYELGLWFGADLFEGVDAFLPLQPRLATHGAHRSFFVALWRGRRVQ